MMNDSTKYISGTIVSTAGVTTIVTSAIAYGSVAEAGSIVLSVAVFVAVLFPLYDPQPRRTIDVIKISLKRITAGCLAMITFGTTGILSVPSLSIVAVLGILLAVMIPLSVCILQRYTTTQRTVVVGDDPLLLSETIRRLPEEPVGFVSPVLSQQQLARADKSDVARSSVTQLDEAKNDIAATDGGGVLNQVDSLAGVNRLCGLSQLGHTLDDRSINTVVLALDEADRQECFGVLRVCHDAGVDVLARREINFAVLEADRVNDFILVNLEPWPWYSRLAKRMFDIAFATAGLVILSPLILVISLAIKLDSPGPILYGQRRTAELGATFPVWKFRSMLPESEDAHPGDDEDRITRFGRVLRRTHMDEIPQLLSILVGDMSVVGPRAAWTNEEAVLMRDVNDWPKRWAIPPGLTGLAQIRGVDSTDCKGKLEADLEYIQRQSLIFDLSIVTAQIWDVLHDCIDMLTPTDHS